MLELLLTTLLLGPASNVDEEPRELPAPKVVAAALADLKAAFKSRDVVPILPRTLPAVTILAGWQMLFGETGDLLADRERRCRRRAWGVEHVDLTRSLLDAKVVQKRPIRTERLGPNA